MTSIVGFIRTHWATIAALNLAGASVLWPEDSPATEKFLTVFAAIFGAVGMGAASARLAVRSEALRLSLLPQRRPRD